MTEQRTPEELLEEVRATAEGFQVFGELGRRSDRDIWYLARDLETTKLVALRLRQQGVDANGQPEFSLEIAEELDKDVPLGEGECPGCRAPIRSFARFCGRCGTDLTASSRTPETREARAELLEQVRAASEEFYDVIGEMTWGGGAGTVYFAIERETGRLVRLRLKLEGSDYSLGETQAVMALKTQVMASYTSAMPALPALPDPPPAPAPPPGPATMTATPAGQYQAPARSTAGRKTPPVKLLVIGGGIILLLVIAYFAFAG